MYVLGLGIRTSLRSLIVPIYVINGVIRMVNTVKHFIPLVKGSVEKSISEKQKPQLQNVLEKLKTQLGLKYSNDYGTFGRCDKGQEIELLEYNQTPKINFQHLLKKVPKFNFRAEDYPISKSEMVSAPYVFPDSKYPIICQDTPICTNYKELKGPNNDLYALASIRGLTKKKGLHKCKWFLFHYWHSSSFFGNIIKSRPGIMVICHNFNLFNSPNQILGHLPAIMQNTSYPFKYSVYRTRLKKLLRKKFLELYLKDIEVSKSFDGLYKFSVNLYPETEEDVKDFVKHLQICLNKVSKLDLEALQREDEKQLTKIPWYEVEKVLKRNDITDFKFKSFMNKSRVKKITKL